MEKIYWAVLQMAQGIGNVRLRKLVDYFGSGEAAWKASDRELRLSGCLDRSACDQLIVFRNRGVDLDELAKRWEKQEIKICTFEDAEYPEKLKNIFNSPAIFFYRGAIIQAEKRIAIVGARKASPYGRNVAKTLAEALTKAGAEVVSGAARGIDTAAHAGALAAGRTIAVLGCGIDVVYPPENRNLLDQIAENGLVLSEYAPGTAVNAKYFPARNRIISGLSDGVVVVEAALKSGSLITAEFALNEGRDVFAVPGSVFSETSRGCHQLIKQGAKLVDQAEDILEEYRWKNSPQPRHTARDALVLSEEEAVVYQVLTEDQPLAVDEIILKTRTSVSNITLILLQMELRGLIAEQGAHCYVRAMKEGVL